MTNLENLIIRYLEKNPDAQLTAESAAKLFSMSVPHARNTLAALRGAGVLKKYRPPTLYSLANTKGR